MQVPHYFNWSIPASSLLPSLTPPKQTNTHTPEMIFMTQGCGGAEKTLHSIHFAVTNSDNGYSAFGLGIIYFSVDLVKVNSTSWKHTS